MTTSMIMITLREYNFCCTFKSEGGGLLEHGFTSAKVSEHNILMKFFSKYRTSITENLKCQNLLFQSTLF